MRLIERFVEEVFSNEGSFTIEMPCNNDGIRSTHHFLQDKVRKARYVYGISNCYDANSYARLDTKPKVIAIVSGSEVYVVDEFALNVYLRKDSNTALPDNVLMLKDFVKSRNEYVSRVIFPEFYDDLETDEGSIRESADVLKQKARTFILSKDAGIPEVVCGEMLNEQDVADILCGFESLLTKVYDKLNKDREHWITKKSEHEKIRALMRSPEIVADWEIRMAAGIRRANAKTITVEFELNGKTASAKISPERVVRKMIQKDYFSDYDFVVTKRGAELIECLGAGKWRRDDNVLKCEHITKIMYGRKELYVRE